MVLRVGIVAVVLVVGGLLAISRQDEEAARGRGADEVTSSDGVLLALHVELGGDRSPVEMTVAGRPEGLTTPRPIPLTMDFRFDLQLRNTSAEPLEVALERSGTGAGDLDLRPHDRACRGGHPPCILLGDGYRTVAANGRITAPVMIELDGLQPGVSRFSGQLLVRGSENRAVPFTLEVAAELAAGGAPDPTMTTTPG